MKKDHYGQYFKLLKPSFLDGTRFGFTHFFKRINPWEPNYSLIPQKGKGGGRILVGQLPLDSFHADLLEELSPDGLIVSCNEFYELAGSSTIFPVTAPFLWWIANIDHHHLPFKDFSADAEPLLVLEALNKMLTAYQRGSTVYVHCKAGRSRSALLAALLMCALELANKWCRWDTEDLKKLLKGKIAELTKLRPQTLIDKKQIELGVKVLGQYKLQPKEEKERKGKAVGEGAYTQTVKFFAKLTQAPAFKALWHFAFREDYFAEVQIIMKALYKDPLLVLNVLSGKEEPSEADLQEACQKIKGDELGPGILDPLKDFLSSYKNPDFKPGRSGLSLACERFNQALDPYKHVPIIKTPARRVQSGLFLSASPEADRVRWLDKTSLFLSKHKKSDHEGLAEAYYDDAEDATFSNNPAIRRLGKNMVIVAAVALTAILVAGIFAGSTFTLPIVAIIGAAALAFIMLGRYMMENATQCDVKEPSQKLAEVDARNFIRIS